MKIKCACNGNLAPNAICGSISVGDSGMCGVEWGSAKQAAECCDQAPQLIEVTEVTE